MNFDKKMIISFIIIFFITGLGLGLGLGLVGVFFPDAFNGKKQTIAEYTGVIQSQKDAQNAMSFLNKRVKDKKAFKLNLLFCGEIKDGYAEIENKIKDFEAEVPDYFDKTRFEFGLMNWDNDKDGRKYDNHQLCRNYAWCHLDSETDYLVPFYTFPVTMYKNLDNDTPDSLRKECKSGYAYALIDGYAYYKDIHASQDIAYWVNFNEIPESQMMIKKLNL